MSNRMKKVIFISIVVYLAGLFLLRFAVPQSNFIQNEVTDEKISAELKGAAKIALKDYFDIELDESKPWETMIVHNVPREENTLPPVYSVMQKDSTENLPEGEISSYGVAMREDTKEVVSIIYTQVSNAEIKQVSNEDVEKAALDFLKEYEISNGDELKVANIERSKDAELVKVMIEGDGVGYSVAYNLRTDKITYFEKVEIVNSSEK